MVKIRQMLSGNNNHFWGTNPRIYITIHETANTSRGANAEMHARYINNGSSATWHYTVDDKEVVQHYLDTRQCWHAGDGGGAGNTQSIGIEICVNSDGNFSKTIDNAVDLVKMLMGKYKIPLSNVVQHNHWSGKDCPRNLRHGTKGINWNQFKARLSTTAAKPATSNRLYRVQVGAFENKANAIRLRDDLIKQGYKDAFIDVKQLNRVQVGAFSNMANAVRLRDILRKSGYKDAFIR